MNIAGLHCCMCLCKKFHLSANELGIGGGGGGGGCIATKFVQTPLSQI